MKYNKILILILIFYCLFSTEVYCQSLSKKLAYDIQDGQLDDFSRIEAAFIISGADSQLSLNHGLDWFNKLIKDIKEKNLIGFEKVASAERLFLYLHSTLLKDYEKKATTLFDIMKRKNYNCVSGTVLYNLTCDELGLTTQAFETSTHVYTIFSNFNDQVMVENTTSMGFNIMKNLNSYSKYLAKYYPQKVVFKIGLDNLYYHEYSRGRQINNTELLGLICYNLAVFNYESNKYEKAYSYVELAQLFNNDSRSNVDFETQLYYRWGEHLFRARKFYQAFEVTADAFFRYPENNNFRTNCQLSFIKALQELWIEKDWNKTKSIICEMNELKIADEREANYQKNMIKNWI